MVNMNHIAQLGNAINLFAARNMSALTAQVSEFGPLLSNCSCLPGRHYSQRMLCIDSTLIHSLQAHPLPLSSS